MKRILIFLLLILPVLSSGQIIIPGEYDRGLKLAFDKKANMLTGYFESYSGTDEKTNKPMFSCIFYLEGGVVDNKFNIKTYYPSDKPEDAISGTIEIIDSKTMKIKLTEDHGGCWNVQHFSDEAVKFSMEKYVEWIQIRFVTSDKAYFYSDKSIDKKKESYLVKNDFVCIEKIEVDWAYCTYYGDKITNGWIRTVDLNK